MMKPNDQILKSINRADDRILKSIDCNIFQRTDEHHSRFVKKRKNTEIGAKGSFHRSEENEKENRLEPFSKHCRTNGDVLLKTKSSDMHVGQPFSSMSACEIESSTKPPTTALPMTSSVHVNKRKSKCPTRSAAKQDPNFRGVTFLLHTQLQGCDSHLVISAYFSNINMKTAGSHGPVRNRHGSCGSVTSYHTDCWSGSEEDSQLAYHRNNYIAAKTCASCGTRRTPLWRDAEDGTPLCNACGIRFKKYKVRCSQCWHIPKKDIKTFPNCPNCGALLRVSVCRRSW